MKGLVPLALTIAVLALLYVEVALNFTFHWVTDGDLGNGLDLPKEGAGRSRDRRAGAFGGVISTPYGSVFIDALVTLTIGALLGLTSAKVSAAVGPNG